MPLSLDFHIFSGNVTEKCEVLEWGRVNLRIDLGKCGRGPGAGLKKMLDITILSPSSKVLCGSGLDYDVTYS